MIPKIIHYCWFGRGPMPEIAKECIDSWKQFLPDYEIRLWNEDNFDINICQYTSEAYKAGKYAFVSDYARFWILNKYGGLYFDTDVKLLSSPREVLEKGPFMGLEVNGNESILEPARCNPGIGMAAIPGMPMLVDLLSRYNNYRFISPTDNSLNLKTIVEYTTEYLREHGFRNICTDVTHCVGFNIYPKEYFSPRSVDGRSTNITPKTISIHLFTNTWGKKTLTQKLAASLKFFSIRYLIPKSISLAKLERNSEKREIYFRDNFLITK